MNTLRIVYWTGLTLVTGVSLADQPRKSGPNTEDKDRKLALQPLFRYRNVAAPEPNSPAATDPAIVRMEAVQVHGNPFPILREVADDNAQEAAMQACALVRKDLPEHRQIDFFVAPIQLDGHQAGFPLELFRF